MSLMLKGEGDGVGRKERAGVVEMLVGLLLWPDLTLLVFPWSVELSKCFCSWSLRNMLGERRV